MGQGAGTLSRAAGLVAQARQDLDDVSRRLDGQVAGLHGRWVGAGASAFVLLHQAWTERQGRIVAGLDGFAGALTATERDTRATDEAMSTGYRLAAERLG